ncbi:MAG: hypothetical protein IPH86_08460 [bacterium]|nr:hypothetical protein [bacterium]
MGPAEGANFVDFNLDGSWTSTWHQNNTGSTTNLLLLNFGDGGGTRLFTGQGGNLTMIGNCGNVA